jgi:hypothetical protein
LSLIPTAESISLILLCYNYCMANCFQSSTSFGSSPVNVKWNITRGDTGTLAVQFLDDDEVTLVDTSTWEYISSAYDTKGDVLDELEVTPDDGTVTIVAPADITINWGVGSGSIVAELAFDLEITMGDGTVWTPIIGTIVVLGDVSGSL